MNYLRSDQRGNITIAAMIVILVLLIGFISWKVFIKQQDKKEAAQEQETVQTTEQDEETDTPKRAGGNILVVNSRNTVRKNDVSKLLTATAVYASNNLGSMPMSYEDGKLTGADSPAEVGFEHYVVAKVALNEHTAITSDAVVLVTGAECGTDNAAATSTSSRNYVALYGLEQTDGSFKAACYAG